MLKGQRKVNIAGSASGLGLLLLAFLLVNPLVGSLSASALEILGDEADSAEAGEPVAQADTNESRVEISFTPTEVSGEMTPTTAAGLKKQLEAMVTVTIQNAEDYTIYIGAKTTGLVGVNSGEVIESIKSATSYEDLAANSWGIYYGEGTTVSANATYLPVETGRGMRMEAGGRTTSTLTKTYSLGFAANINNQMPADTYENQITLSVVSSPLEITNAFGIETMQEMTSTICADVEAGTTDRLQDARDGKLYWVAKLPDNNCWMVQNLDLDLGTEWPDASLSDYDVASTVYKPVTTATTATTATTDASNTATRSWSLGDYVIINPTVSSDCGYPKNDLTNCPAQFASIAGKTASTSATFYADNGNKTYTADEYDAHYLVGNHYQWNTATAGTGGTITSGQASGSICPKGWKLPTSNNNLSGNFSGLVAAGEIGTSVAKLTTPPYHFVRGGYVHQSASLLYEYGGQDGNYWSSTPYSTNDIAYRLIFNSTNSITTSASNGRNRGYSVRCLVR